MATVSLPVPRYPPQDSHDDQVGQRGADRARLHISPFPGGGTAAGSSPLSPSLRPWSCISLSPLSRTRPRSRNQRTPWPVTPGHQPIPATATPSSSLPPGVAPLTQLLPSDIDDPATQCQPHTPHFHVPGLIQSLNCIDPGLPGGDVFAYQANGPANYQTALLNFNI